MAENVSRFGLSEMMNILREAVRQSRQPANYLNGREVSKYMKNKYGFNKKYSSVSSVPQIQELTPSPQQAKRLTTHANTKEAPPKDQTKEDNSVLRAKSLPRILLPNAPPKAEVKKSVSGTSLLDTPYDYYRNDRPPIASVSHKWDKKVKEPKEEEVKPRNLKKQAKRLIQNVTGTLLPEKSTVTNTSTVYAKADKAPQHQLSTLGMSRNINAEKWNTRKLDNPFQREEQVKGNSVKNKALEAKKLSGLTRKGIVYSRLAAKHLAMKQASSKSKKTSARDKVEKVLHPDPEPKTWIQIKTQDQAKTNSKYRSFLDSFPNKYENIARKTREVRAKLIEDLKLVEQRKEIEVLRRMARESLNRHIDDLKESRKPSFA